jgi:hypothetical protein
VTTVPLSPGVIDTSPIPWPDADAIADFQPRRHQHGSRIALGPNMRDTADCCDMAGARMPVRVNAGEGASR